MDAPTPEALQRMVKAATNGDTEAVLREALAVLETRPPAEPEADPAPPQGDRFADFDAFFAERDAAETGRPEGPVMIRLYGRVWDLGTNMPAAAALRMARLGADGEIQDLDLKDPRVACEVMALGGDLIPPPVMRAWQERGIDIDRLGEVILWAFGQFLSRDEAGGQGEAEPPATGGSTSSSPAGPSSRPTSASTTGSTSPTRRH